MTYAKQPAAPIIKNRSRTGKCSPYSWNQEIHPTVSRPVLQAIQIRKYLYVLLAVFNCSYLLVKFTGESGTCILGVKQWYDWNLHI